MGSAVASSSALAAFPCPLPGQWSTPSHSNLGLVAARRPGLLGTVLLTALKALHSRHCAVRQCLGECPSLISLSIESRS